MGDLDLKLKVSAEIADAKAKLQQTVDSVKDVANKTVETGKATVEAAKSFYDFGASAALAMVNLSRSIISATGSLYQFAQSTLGLTVKLDTSNLGLKTAGFLIQNLRKEFTISLGFLKSFADYLDKVNFPITPITNFINLMSKFNVVVGIGKGQDTVFDKLKDGAVKTGEVASKISLSNLKDDIASAARSLLLFAANATVAFKSLKEGIARESAFSQASRTIEGTDEQVKGLKKTLDDLATTDLSVTTEELYAVAGVAGAMGKAVEDIPTFVRTVSEGVVALNIPAEELAQRLGTLQTQLNLTEEGLVSLSDQVNTVADTLPGKVSELDVFEVLSRGVATAGKNFGLLKGETVGLTGALLSLGEAPETARTSLVNLLSSLQNSKNQTDDFQLGLEQLGTSSGKLATDIKDKPLPALMQLLDTMHGMSNAARLDIATKLLGKGQDAIALAKLVDNTTLLKEAIKSATDETVYSGSVHAAYQKQIATTDSKITLLKNATSTFSESLTSTFLPAIQIVIDGFRKLVNALSAFSQNHPIFKTFAAVGVTVMSLAGMMRVLSLAMTAVGLAPSAIMPRLAALGASLIALNANAMATIASLFTLARTGSAFSLLKTAMSFLFGGTIGLAVGAIALLGVGIANLLPVTTRWGETTATVGEIIAAMWKTIVDGFQPAVDAINAGIDGINAWLESLGIADGLVGLLKNSLEFIGVVIVNTGGLFKAFAETLGNYFGFAVQSAIDFVQTIDDIFSGKGIGTSLDNYIERTKSNINELFKAVNESGKNARNAVQDFEENTAKNLKKTKTIDEKDTRAADGGVDINAPVDDKKTADEQARIAKEALDRRMQLLRDEAAEKIRLYSQVAATQKQIDDFTFQQKLLSEQNIALLINQQLTQTLAATNTDATAKRTALLNIEQATALQVKNLIALEQEHRNKAIAFSKEIEATEQQRLINNTALDQIGLSGSELYEVKKRQLATDTAKIKQLIAEGEFAKAAELGKKTIDLAAQIAETEKKSDVARKQSSYSTQQAREQYNQTVELTKTALEGASKAELAQANIAKAEADKRKLSLEEVRAKIGEIEQAVQGGVELKVSADTSAVDAAKARIQQPTHSTHTIDVVENRVQAHATGGYIYAFANGGYAGLNAYNNGEQFPRKNGKITGKGTGTSDEVPAMLSNGEYVFTAKTTARIGVKNLDAINYGNKDPEQINVQKYALGGAVGDDKLKQRAAELRKQQYEIAVQTFDDPRNQILWSMDGTTTGSQDANAMRKRFEYHVGEYLRKNNLPIEWRDLYLAKVSSEQILKDQKASVEDKAKASLAIEEQAQSFAPKATPQPTTTPSLNASPVLPSITPPNFSPSIPASSALSPAGNSGKTSTVRFVAPDNSTLNATVDANTDVNAFFDKINNVSGVTRI